MFCKISTWAFLLVAVTDVLASPLSFNNYGRSTDANLVDRQIPCPPGEHCGHGPECATIFCHLPNCVDAPACQNHTSKPDLPAALANRQFECPPGIECGPGPVCTSATCDLPGCADAEVCQGDQDQKRSAAASLMDRQFGCPTGLECGHGPVCTSATCDLPGCADAEVCQDIQDQKRSAKVDIAERDCDICRQQQNGNFVCGGCGCTAETCDNPRCALLDICTGPLNQKRSAKTEFPRPICDLCEVNDEGVIVCCGVIQSEGLKHRDTERICPLYCITTEDGEELCGCEAQDYERSMQGVPPKA